MGLLGKIDGKKEVLVLKKIGLNIWLLWNIDVLTGFLGR